MDPSRKSKECGKHEKPKNETEILRICETCGRHYYVCELCRSAKGIEAPLSICMKCAPALKTLRNVLDKKDLDLYETQNKLKKYETEYRVVDEMKKQIHFLKKQNEEYRIQLRGAKEELNSLRKTNEKLANNLEQVNEELRPKQELVRDLKSLLTTQDHSDCQLTIGGHKYLAHKCILSARSEVLRKLLSPQTSANLNDPKNKQAKPGVSTQNNQVEMNDIDPEIVPFLLNYLYTGEAENGINDRNVPSVMKVADKFDLAGLRNACLGFMENRINRGTVIPILIEAYELNNERLKNKCMKYIQDESIDLINSTQWNTFKVENPKLALALYERYVKENKTAESYSPTGQITARSQNNGFLPKLSSNTSINSNGVWNPNNNLSTTNKLSHGPVRNVAIDR